MASEFDVPISVISPFKLAPALSKSGRTSAFPPYAARNSGSALKSGRPCDCDASAPGGRRSRHAGCGGVPYYARTSRAVDFASEGKLTVTPLEIRYFVLSASGGAILSGGGHPGREARDR